uniref:FANCI_HD2 domain-containing protein n=1 Tax=Parastrongyloides trichosuri TaxID=131310 RepID=A0A0N4ZM95_PARTI
MSTSSQRQGHERWLQQFIQNVNNLSFEYCELADIENSDPSKFETYKANVTKSYSRADYAGRYESLYKDFLEKSKNDGGRSFCTFLKRFIYALDHVEQPELHAIAMAKHILNALHFFELNHYSSSVLLKSIQDIITYISFANLLDLADIVNTKISETKDGKNLTHQFLLGSSFILQRIYIFNNISTKDTDGRSGVTFVQTFFCALLENTKNSSFCDAYRFVSIFNVPDIYPLYIENIFANEFEFFSLSQRSEFLKKCFNFLENMKEKDMRMLFEKYFSTWSNLNSEMLIEIKPMILDFFNIISKNGVITSRLLSMLKSTITTISNSSFGFTIAIVLCSSKNLGKKAVKDVVEIFIRLWKSSFSLDNNAWLVHVVGPSPASTWKEKFSTLFKVIAMDDEYKEIFLPGLEDLCFSMFAYRTKESGQKISRGVIIEDGSIAFLGKWIFLEILEFDMMTFHKCIEWLLKLIRNSFGSNDSCIFYIDIIVSVVKRYKHKLDDCSTVLSGFIENIFKSPNGDMCSTVIRALLPTIMDHVELRQVILEEVKTSIRQVSTQDKVIPILLLLLRAVTEQSDVIEMNNCSQSFATYSSLTAKNGYKKTPDETIALDIYSIIKSILRKSSVTKSILYKCLIDNCTKNSNIIPHSLYLMYDEICNIKGISIDDLVMIDRGSIVVKQPLPQLIASITRITKLAVVRDVEEKVANGILYKIEEKVEGIIEMIKEKTLEELDITEESCKPTSNAHGTKCGVYAKLMLQLYNISLEYLWNFGNILDKKSSYESFRELLNRREELKNIIMTSESKTTLKRKTSILTTCFDKLSPIDLDNDILGNMLSVVVTLKEEGSTSQILSEENRLTLARFVVQTFHEKMKNADVSNCHAVYSVKMLRNGAINLYQIYFAKEGPFFSGISIEDNIRTLALETFIYILIYLTKKYEDSSSNQLEVIYKEILKAHSKPVKEQVVKEIAEEEYTNILANYYTHFITNNFLNIMDSKSSSPHEELSKRGLILIIFFNHISDSLPNVFCSIKKTFLINACKTSMKISNKENSPHVTEVVNELWKLIFKLVYNSQIYSNNNIGKMLTTVVESIVYVYASKDETDDKYRIRILKSITFTNVNVIYIMYIKTIEKMIENIEVAIQIYTSLYSELTNEFLTLLFKDFESIVKYITDIVETSIDYECNKDSTAEMLTNLYKVLTSILKQFTAKSNQKKEMLQWSCLDILSNIIKEDVNSIIKICKKKLCSKNVPIESESVSNVVKRKLITEYKKKDAIFNKYDLAMKHFEIALLQLNSKFNDEKFTINDKTIVSSEDNNG